MKFIFTLAWFSFYFFYQAWLARHDQSSSSEEGSDSSFDGPIFIKGVDPLTNLEAIIPWLEYDQFDRKQIRAVFRRARATIKYYYKNDPDLELEMEAKGIDNMQVTISLLEKYAKLKPFTKQCLAGKVKPINSFQDSDETIAFQEQLAQLQNEKKKWERILRAARSAVARFLIQQMISIKTLRQLSPSLRSLYLEACNNKKFKSTFERLDYIRSFDKLTGLEHQLVNDTVIAVYGPVLALKLKCVNFLDFLYLNRRRMDLMADRVENSMEILKIQQELDLLRLSSRKRDKVDDEQDNESVSKSDSESESDDDKGDGSHDPNDYDGQFKLTGLEEDHKTL